MITNESMQRFCKERQDLVLVKETSNPELFILKYRKRVFFKNLWNEFLEECRGTIVDKDFNPVSLPFTKIYNTDVESRAPRIAGTTLVTAHRKVNGFMAALTYHNGQLLISTTGSIDSDFVQYIRDSIDYGRYLFVCQMFPEYTFMFECVHKDDPHIISEELGMYLLAYRKKEWNSPVVNCPRYLDFFASEFGCFKPESFQTTLDELRQLTKTVQHEGFVWYDDNGNAGKMKSPFYLVSKALARKADILQLNKQIVDEEYYDLIDHLLSMKDEFNALDEQSRLSYIREYLEKEALQE